MEKTFMYHEVHKTKIYKDVYRPNASLSRFIKTLWSIILIGDSPISKHAHYPGKKK